MDNSRVDRMSVKMASNSKSRRGQTLINLNKRGTSDRPEINVSSDCFSSPAKCFSKSCFIIGSNFKRLIAALDISNGKVNSFKEKPQGDGNRINGGFFVLNKKIMNYIDDNKTMLERKPLEKLAAIKELKAFKHEGFWQPMDTLRDKTYLQELWEQGDAPWKIW